MDVESLINLEKIDKEIARLEKSKKSLPRELDELENELAEKKDACEAAENKLKNAELESDHARHQVEANRTELDKSNEKLLKVTKEREYDAVLHEIRERKRMIDKEQKRLSKLAQQIAEAQEEFEALTQEYNDRRDELQPQIDEMKETLANIDSDVEAVRRDRPALEEKIDKRFLTVYRRIQEKRDSGRALSVIDFSSTFCSNCYQVITPNIVRLASKVDYPVFCENCGSIFVYKKVDR
ncbi:MAG: zinc ribbon domain-containing protein [Fibrobacterota bacterium]